MGPFAWLRVCGLRIQSSHGGSLLVLPQRTAAARPRSERPVSGPALSGIGDRVRELPWSRRGARGRQWNGRVHRESGQAPAAIGGADLHVLPPGWRHQGAAARQGLLRFSPWHLAQRHAGHFQNRFQQHRCGFIGASLRHAGQQVFCWEQRETELLHLSRPAFAAGAGRGSGLLSRQVPDVPYPGELQTSASSPATANRRRHLPTPRTAWSTSTNPPATTIFRG
jgi:hypothetical protein